MTHISFLVLYDNEEDGGRSFQGSVDSEAIPEEDEVVTLNDKKYQVIKVDKCYQTRVKEVGGAYVTVTLRDIKL